jgi:Kef-type K+ transport system membrane component KefB
MLLGALAAGSVVGLARRGEGGAILRHKLDAIGFGFLNLIFFVPSGIKFDGEALLASPSALLCLPVFLLCFLVVRGMPVCLYRREVDKADLLPLVLYVATVLSLVAAISPAAGHPEARDTGHSLE